mmetsp:Transcript_6005/g.10669  ORF Transcript_6005/g.10669 Transcript_6005/m.10669 type:complete len:94 (+) Transcript_6005:1-282(+)
MHGIQFYLQIWCPLVLDQDRSPGAFGYFLASFIFGLIFAEQTYGILYRFHLVSHPLHAPSTLDGIPTFGAMKSFFTELKFPKYSGQDSSTKSA